MAHKKAGGSTKNGRDSNPQYRGVKVYAGTVVKPGMIISRQVGSHFHPGENTAMGKDYTIFSTAHGVVRFMRQGKLNRQKVFVDPIKV
jgi:large subunit ribosomal protein L27